MSPLLSITNFLEYKKEQFKEIVYLNSAVQLFLGSVVFFIGIILYPIRWTKLISIQCICWVGRVINIKVLEKLSFLLIRKLFLKKSGNNEMDTILSEIFFKGNNLLKSVSIYNLDGESNKVCLFRDIIVLKKKKDNEKGVILIKYTPAFDAFYYYFNYDKIIKDYYLVLEPSWAGVCDPSILMFWRETNNKNVIVQAIEPKDYQFVENLGGNFMPISIGSADWVDLDVFSSSPNTLKLYDIVMVSNWGIHKKHMELFRALSKTKMKLSVLLIGFASGRRSKSDIFKEIEKFNLNHIRFDIKEGISAKKVAELLSRSKVFVLLSQKEGPNKAIIEAFFSNVPAILYKNFIGGAQMRINRETGILSSYGNLHKAIEEMVVNYTNFSPRSWILRNSGSRVTTQKLNNLLKRLAIKNGECWNTNILEKINSPNLQYKDPANRIIVWDNFISDYKR